MLVYVFDYDSRLLLGNQILDDSDMSPEEPGLYLLPGNTTAVVPPDHDPSTHRCFWREGAWRLDLIPVVPPPDPPTLAERRAALKDAATAQRWNVETGGVALPNGVKVRTGIDDQSRIDSVIGGMKANGYADVPFKAASGWVTLTLVEIEAIRCAVAEHVRQCFLAERAHHEAIDLLDAAGIDTYDINTGWPAAATYLREH